MSDLVSFVQNQCNPNPEKAGNFLFGLNIFSMIMAAVANTAAVAIDKNTKNEDKKFLIPAGMATGAANIGLYFAITKKLIKKFEDYAQKTITKLEENGTFTEKVQKYVDNKIQKAEHGLFNTGIGKEKPEVLKSMKSTFYDDTHNLTKEAIKEFKDSVKGGASVMGAFAGVIIGCGFLTPIIRDVSAYFVQKKMEENNPDLKDKPFNPYFDPSHLKVGVNVDVPKQPLTLKNYMAFTNGSLKI